MDRNKPVWAKKMPTDGKVIIIITMYCVCNINIICITRISEKKVSGEGGEKSSYVEVTFLYFTRTKLA